jgi:CRISPR-associated endoribonuclease Cas6
MPAAISLPAIPYLRLRFLLRAEGSAHLPEFKGSLLRGAFGHALRRLVCAMGPEQPCPTCTLRHACVHTRLFETLIGGEPPPFLRGLPTSPRPYVFEPREDRREFAAGDPLEFDLLLLGQAMDLQAFAVLAVERMATAGLGASRHPFQLASVRYLGPDGSWAVGQEAGGRPWQGAGEPCFPTVDPAGARRATLRFLTPTRIKVRNHLVDRPELRELVFRAVRRCLELAHFHLPGADLDWNIRPLLEHARTVRTVASQLTWRDWERYSNRQKTRMTLGGFVGEMQIEGDLGPLLPALRSAEVVHLGKGATFGLGKLEVEVEAS